MKRPLLVCTGLLVLGACAPGLPPAPRVAPLTLPASQVPSIAPLPESPFPGTRARWDTDVRPGAGATGVTARRFTD